MLQRILILCACLLAIPAYPVKAAGMPMERFSYSADFEEKDPVTFWTGGKDYTVNFKGLTDEKSIPGGKCFKLDLTFGSNSYIYWRIRMPRRVPAEGSLKFTGNVFAGEETTAGKVEIGPSYSYVPSMWIDTTPPMYRVAEKGKWVPVEGDLVEIGKNIDLGAYDWGDPELSNVGVYLTDMLIRLYGKKGDRAVLYLDDFKIEGEVPASDSYGKEVAARWAPMEEKIGKELRGWQCAFARNDQDINSVVTKTETAALVKKDALEKLAALKERVGAINKNIAWRNGAITSSEQQEMEYGIRELNAVSRYLLMLNGTGNRKLVITTVSPISSVPVLPAGLYGTPGGKMAVTAAQGEYEPASFVVHAMQDTKALTVKATDLKQGKYVIPASSIDTKAIKCWYQAGTAWYGIGQDKKRKVLVPDLMLNDDTLVKVDTEKKDNYLRLSFPGGEKYEWISDTDDTLGLASFPPVDQFPVKDSPLLLPVDIPANTNKQFWITVKVPENAAPGIYTGKVRIASAGGDKAELTLSLNVLPFKLPKPYYDSSIYYRGILDPKGVGSISSERKNRVQLAAELKDLAAHGVTRPIFFQRPDNKGLMKEHLDMRAAAGIENDPLYYSGFWPPDPPADLIQGLLDFTTKNGISEVYIYGVDEAKGDALVAQRDKWAEIHKLGGKVFVAGYKGENFKKMGDMQDLLVCARQPSAKEAEQWHSKGHKIWCYANPQGGVEDPEIYRRNFGLLLWQNNYDGAATYAYQHSFGNIWNDFDHAAYRDHVFAYPTVDGVVDTIAWEGYREGVDDVRYMTLLQQSIERAEKSGSKRLATVAKQAKGYLKTINAENDDLSSVRSKMVDYILKLR